MTTAGPRAARADLLRRLFVGRRMASGRMPHTLLPKVLALPIFASDALSSVAYSVEASLLIMWQAASDHAYGLVIPVNLAVMAVMAIVVASYRQVVRAYPTSAGSYVVSRDNLAPLFGLIAAAALLSDYVLTVAVSVSSGVFAVSSAIASGRVLDPHIVPISIGCVALLTLVNLRGVRETGFAFATPTYVFLAAMLALIAVGIGRCIGSCPQVTAVPKPEVAGTAGAVGLFVLLHAFSSGSSALTGTEAISNGVSAFRRPQGRNAAQMLGMLGAIAVAMVMGTAYLAWRTHPIPSRQVSMVSEIARAVFGGGFLFWLVQISTFAILILAANTSFQGFPRLAALLARDRYIPRQFENLGDRLVYSNGMVVLALFAILLIWAFQANVDALLQLYVVGVFTAFTLSQIGMVRFWRRAAREGSSIAQGWRRRLAINATGGVATGVVLAVVILTKFTHGAWIVILAVPLMILGFLRVRHHYASVATTLRSNLSVIERAASNVVVLLVPALDAATAEAIGYVRSMPGVEMHAVHVGDGVAAERFARRWRSFSRTDVELEILDSRGRAVTAVLREYLERFPRGPGRFVTVVVPEVLRRRSLVTAVRRAAFRLKVRLLSEPWVVVTDVPVLAGTGGAEGGRDQKTMLPGHVEVLVFVSAVHDGTVRAVNYAASMRATAVRAVFFAMDHEEVEPIIRQWEERRVPLELDIVDAPFRELGGPILEEVRKVTSRPDALAVVVIPEVVVTKWWQQLLHGQRALFIKRLLLFEDRVIVTSVPYQLRFAEEAARGDRAGAGVRA